MTTDLATRHLECGQQATSAAGPAATSRSPAAGRAVVPLALVGLSSLAPLVGDAADWRARVLLAGLAAGTLLGAVGGHRASARLGLGLTATVAAGVLLPWQVGWWPIPGVVGVAVYLLSYALGRDDEPGRHHPVLRLGRLAGAEAGIVLGLVVCSASALVVFSWSHPPRLGTGARLMEGMSPWAIVAAGLAFAAVNAVVEEVLFRGMVQQHLARLLGSWPAVPAQALAFGFLHLHGYPYGPVGVALASVYGLALGALRLRSGGLLAPWVAHACADAAIFALIVDTAL